MAIDWPALLASHNIEYVTTGPNVGPGFIAVHCPLCGADDPSEHMTIHLNGTRWRCWRNPSHRGTNAAYLLALLLGISTPQAAALIGRDALAALPEDFLGAVNERMGGAPKAAPEALALPAEFRPIRPSPTAAKYIAYLARRGFKRQDIMRMSERYDMRFATRGDYHGRIIFLVYHEGDLIAWTGRSIYATAFLRYDSEGELSKTILWHDQLERSSADTIVLCEGPFDALKVSVLGRPHGIVGSCFFTAAPTDAQVRLLYRLLPRFRNRFLMLDEAATTTTLRVAPELGPMGVIPLHLSRKYKDPGELDEAGLLDLVAPQILF